MKVILFDCFGVLSSPVYSTIFEKYFSDQIERQEWMDKFVDLDLAMLSEEDLVTQLSSRLKISEDTLRMEINNTPELNRQLLDYIRGELKGKYTIGVLSNIVTSIFDRIMTSELDLFDILFISSELRLVKPDLRIYQVAIEKSGVEPSEILFIDDRAENIEAAQKLGINGIVYKDFASFWQELAVYL
jgi:putative hydrolase of the HAD superfamily